MFTIFLALHHVWLIAPIPLHVPQLAFLVFLAVFVAPGYKLEIIAFEIPFV